MKEQNIKDVKELVPLAQMAETSEESKEFWDEYRERVRIREKAQKGLVEPRKNTHL